MSTTLTIRNLDEDVKQKLRLRAASHQRSMEAEAREILAVSLAGSSPISGNDSPAMAERRRRMEAVVGIWKDRYKGKSTDKIMRELRGDD
jgi:antitoxin FitA